MSDAPLQYILSKEEWDYFRECEADAVRYRWLLSKTGECSDACGTFLDFPRIDCHQAPNKADISTAIDIEMFKK